MLHDKRPLVSVLIAAAAAWMPVPASASDRQVDAIILAQAPNPEEDKKAKKAQEKEERRQQKQEKQEQRKEGQEQRQDNRQGKQKERKEERQDRQQDRARDQEQRKQQQQENAKQRQDEQYRRQEEKARNEQQKQQQRDAERARKQAEDDKRRLERDQQKARQEQLKEDDRNKREAEDDQRRRGVNVDPNVKSAKPSENRRIRKEEIRQSYKKAERKDRSFDDLKRNRRERTIADGNLRVIEEPDKRVIVKQNNRVFIRHDESERFRRISPDARTIRGADGTSTTFMTRKGGIRIYDVSDRHGRLLHRYRRYPNGREVILIDNRRHYNRDRNRTRDVLIGAGIGLVVGSAIALSAPDVRIPRDEYIVDYDDASDEDIYDALSAPPVERLDRGYSLDEIRYSAPLRDRMRRIDLDTVTFDFGSWEVGPDQGRALDRLAEGINRVLERNPDEIFMVEGHTDAVGTEEDNLTLSDRRAQAVAEILTTEYGVPPENLVTQGYGEEQLKVPTDGPERANRRITARRIGPLLTGRFEADQSSGGPRGDDGPYDDRGDDDDGRYDDPR
jgi:outer membrane protein OmpA-like peptidoglycan-associated protein